MIIYFVFCLCSPILLNGFFNDMICMINTDSIFTFDCIHIEDL